MIYLYQEKQPQFLKAFYISFSVVSAYKLWRNISATFEDDLACLS